LDYRTDQFGCLLSQPHSKLQDVNVEDGKTVLLEYQHLGEYPMTPLVNLYFELNSTLPKISESTLLSRMPGNEESALDRLRRGMPDTESRFDSRQRGMPQMDMDFLRRMPFSMQQAFRDSQFGGGLPPELASMLKSPEEREEEDFQKALQMSLAEDLKRKEEEKKKQEQEQKLKKEQDEIQNFYSSNLKVTEERSKSTHEDLFDEFGDNEIEEEFDEEEAEEEEEQEEDD